MGTRALISKDGKRIIATHWDGYPESLGNDLKNAKTDREIIEQASKHSIDMIDKNFAPEQLITVNDEGKVRTTYFTKTDKEMVEIGKKVGLIDKKLSTKEAIKNGFGTANSDGTVKLSSAGNMKNYGDWAEWEYNFKDGEWFARPLTGSGEGNFKKLKELI